MKVDRPPLRNRHNTCRFSVLRAWLLTFYSVLFFLSRPLALAQTPLQAQMVGTWVGVHVEWDIDFFCTLPTYLQLTADGTYQLGLIDGSAVPQRSTWAIHKDSVRFDAIRYAPGLVTVKNDVLTIGTAYPMVFRRFTDVVVDSSRVYRIVSGKSWQRGNTWLNLYANGKASLENVLTNQRTAHFWQLARFGSSVFLIIRGNQHGRDTDYKSFWQIVDATDKEVKTIGWSDQAVSTETFRLIKVLAPGDSCQSNSFQTCGNCFRIPWNDVSLGASHRRYDLLQLLARHYMPVQEPDQSGLLRIRFVVNCNGEPGSFSVHGFGEDYCSKSFDNRIVNQLLTLCRNQIAPDESLRLLDNRNERLRDITVTLTFRLKDGRISDILP